MTAATAALVLACIGGGTALKPDSATISGSQSGSYDYGQGHYSGTFSGSIDGTRQQQYADQVDIEMNGNEGRIRFPKAMTPIIRGGKNGWFKLRDLDRSGRAITASIGINFINRPKLHIDRVTTVINITGMGGDYTGQCKKVETDAEPQF